MQLVPLGEQSLLVEFDQRIDPDVNRQVIALHQRLANLAHDAIVSCTPAFCSLGIGYDPASISFEDLASLVQQQFDLIQTVADQHQTVKRIPVCYSDACGIDLQHVAATTGLSRKQIIELHSGKIYRAYMLGFLPGFAYLGSVDSRLRVERQSDPRLKVEAGSVGLAGEQTGVYPCAAPGGWQIIGRTPISLIGGNDLSQWMISPGDQVQFYPIQQAEFDSLLEQDTKGQPKDKVTAGQYAESIQGCKAIGLHFKTAGLRTSIQDFGRPGHQNFGIPSGGVMDRFSATIANRLVGNDDHASLIEITLLGPAIEFSDDCQIAITGADLTPKLDGKTIPMWETVSIKSKQRLSFGSRQSGCRSYLAIAGQIAAPSWLGSVSPSPSGANPATDYHSLKGQTLSVSVAARSEIKRSFPPTNRPACLAQESTGAKELVCSGRPRSRVELVLGARADGFSSTLIRDFAKLKFNGLSAVPFS